ncbi:MAG: haloacid dehalogenase type II [Proteobacteria bacterium]|nr:haloacid dehalogenase type II [Pseudomonadota bacterium]
MRTDRRKFLLGAGALATGWSVARSATPSPRNMHKQPHRSVKAIAFDAFPLIDPRPVAQRAEELFPGRGADLSNLWRTRQFEYTWLRTMTGRYVDFWRITEDALIFAADSAGLTLRQEDRERLMHSYLELKAWDDVRSALEAFRDAGIRMAFLSNFTSAMLNAAVKNSALGRFFEEHLTTDRVHAFKPDPRAYAMAPEAFGMAAEDIVFCASASWDAAGAKGFGYQTFWMNRAHQTEEQLEMKPDETGYSMADLSRFVFQV